MMRLPSNEGDSVARIRDIVIDCRDAPALAGFWADVLDGYDVRPYDADEIARLAQRGLTPETDPVVAVDGTGPTLFFQKVPEQKVAKNRLHLDLTADDRAGEVARLRELGATVYDELPRWTVMRDPEGNEFCVFDSA
jgi:Glyoxalase-like domain